MPRVSISNQLRLVHPYTVKCLTKCSFYLKATGVRGGKDIKIATALKIGNSGIDKNWIGYFPCCLIRSKLGSATAAPLKGRHHGQKVGW